MLWAAARRRCCAEAQARGVRGGGSPPGKFIITINPLTTATAGLTGTGLHRRLMGKRLHPGRAGISPPAFSFPGPVRPIPPGEGDRGARGDNNTMAFCTYPLAQSGGSGGAKPHQGGLMVNDMFPGGAPAPPDPPGLRSAQHRLRAKY